MKCYQLFFLAFFCIHLTHAQEVFIDGYVVINQNDTLHGLIAYGNWGKNPTQIKFKRSLSAPAEVLLPETVRLFYIEKPNEYYAGAKIALDKSPQDRRLMPYYNNKEEFFAAYKPVTESVFLLVEVLGKLNLYFLRDDMGKEHYLANKADEPIKELGNYQFMVRLNPNDSESYKSHIRLTTIPSYKNDLSVAMGDCPTLQVKIRKLQYELSELKSIFNEYNACAGGSGSKYIKTKEVIQSSFGIIAGFAQNIPQIKSTYYTNTNFVKNIHPNFGISFNVVFPRNKGKISLFNALYFNSCETQGTDDDFPDFYSIKKIEYTYTSKMIELSSVLRYRLTSGKVNPFIQGGFLVGRKYNIAMTETKYRSLGNPVTIDLGLIKTKTLLGFVAGAGLMWKKWTLEGRLAVADELYLIGNTDDFRTVIQNLQVWAGYKFK